MHKPIFAHSQAFKFSLASYTQPQTQLLLD